MRYQLKAIGRLTEVAFLRLFVSAAIALLLMVLSFVSATSVGERLAPWLGGPVWLPGALLVEGPFRFAEYDIANARPDDLAGNALGLSFLFWWAALFVILTVRSRKGRRDNHTVE